MYKPKKKRYNDLRSLYKEMLASKQKGVTFDGIKIVSKKAEYMMYDGELIIKDLTKKSKSV